MVVVSAAALTSGPPHKSSSQSHQSSVSPSGTPRTCPGASAPVVCVQQTTEMAP